MVGSNVPPTSDRPVLMFDAREEGDRAALGMIVDKALATA